MVAKWEGEKSGSEGRSKRQKPRRQYKQKMRIKKQIPISILILAVLLLALATLPVASATTTTIQPSSADSYIVQDHPTDTHGGDTYIEVETYLNANERGIIKFDLTDVPSGAQITSATLYLYLYYASSPHLSRTYGAHRVTSDWIESEVSWNNNKSGTSWSSSGGDYISSATSTNTFSLGWPTSNPRFISWDVTDDVSAFVGGTATNYGWIVKDKTENAAQQYKRFYSKEYSDTTKRPKLEVTYYTPTVTSCNSSGYEINQFAQGETVYVKATGLPPNTNYKIWIQDNPITDGKVLDTNEDPSNSQESVTSNANGNLIDQPVSIWAILSGADSHHEYDIVLDNQDSGTVGTYNAADDGLDSTTVAGIVAPVPDVSSLVLFASGLMLVSVYFVYGRRRKEEGK